MDTNKDTIVRLLDLTKDLKLIVSTNEPDFRELEDKTLDYLRVVNRQIKRLEAARAKVGKVVGKPAK